MTVGKAESEESEVLPLKKPEHNGKSSPCLDRRVEALFLGASTLSRFFISLGSKQRSSFSALPITGPKTGICIALGII